MRVTGAEGLILLLRIDDARAEPGSMKFETAVPGEYELELGNGGPATAHLADTDSLWSGTEDSWLRAEFGLPGKKAGR